MITAGVSLCRVVLPAAIVGTVFIPSFEEGIKPPPPHTSLTRPPPNHLSSPELVGKIFVTI